ncbi:hypothetical protein CO678_35065 [Bradyrhizobium diazoefficiens]|uniref:hypothetical protein n=1 Tax=Bradyrhizobium diazoefficiens TaxID=1355477 RepID=UPI000BE920E6|nr:hypothetical protein [Bradyrhizobium diazoefficiens]PDT57101.1 hypothetical protein CO678_35065 [Bradyrhizobium diazoefficiens]
MLRILLIAAMMFAAAPAFAQDAATSITITLTPDEVVALQRSLDRSRFGQAASAPPAGFWPLQVKLIQSLGANPEAKNAFNSLRGAR